MKILAFVVIAIPICYYLYLGANVFIREQGDFVPTPDNGSDYGRAALVKMNEVSRIVTWELEHSGTQRAFYAPPSNGSVLIYLHGSPGKASGLYPEVKEMSERGFGMLVIDLPGYGESEGVRNWDEDYVQSLVSGIDFLESQSGVDGNRIGVVGFSMGACIAAKAFVVDQRISGLVMIASYTNFSEHLRYRFRSRVPGLSQFAIAAAKIAGVDIDSMNSEEALAKADQRPVFVISGTRDSGIPTAMARQLANSVVNGELWLVPNAGHIDLKEQAGKEYFDRIADFFSKSLEPHNENTNLTIQPSGTRDV